MHLKHLFIAVPAALLILGNGAANAGQTINDVGAIACVNDKWDEKEVDKGHKLVDYAGRCVDVPDDAAAPKSTADCVGKYEYMPDESWKGSGTCTYTFKGGDKLTDLGGGFAPQGIHVQEYGRHGQTRRRQGRRDVHSRGTDRHAARRQIQGHDRTALNCCWAETQGASASVGALFLSEPPPGSAPHVGLLEALEFSPRR